MNIRRLLFLCAAGLSVGSAPAQNLDLPYSSGSSGADGPFTIPAGAGAAEGIGLAYDAERAEVVRFGGQSVGNPLSQTWLYRTGGWQLVNPAVFPPARAFSAMAFDDTRNEVVLFGGLGDSGRRDDTWVWNGTVWTQKSPATVPPARSHAAMCWDPVRQVIVMASGRGDAQALTDTWLWNGTDWTAGNPLPVSRVGHSMAFYAPLSKVALAGGNSGFEFSANNAQGDLFLWDGENWASSGAVFPPAEMVSLVYDPVQSGLLYFGGMTFTGFAGPGFSHNVKDTLTSWNHVTGSTAKARYPGARYAHGAVWHAAQNRMIVAGGRNASTDLPDTWAWTGAEWFGVTMPEYTFDLTAKTDSIWHFTTIQIPSGVNVHFKKNAANTAVLWLASENVTINGTLDAGGGGGAYGGGLPGGMGSPGGVGGPGGFDGGAGGSQSAPATSGGGPGGGARGNPATDATHADAAGGGTYGSLFAQPAIGGSGGGGLDYVFNFSGASGGGGGGAVVIASSRDIFVNGSILARGGPGGGIPQTGFAGAGSGGLIRLVADRILFGPSGLVDAGDPNAAGKGRARLEAYVRFIPDADAQVKGSKSLSVPVLGSVLNQAGGRLWFSKIAGQNVANPPGGNVINPDVIFTAAGEVQLEVEAVNVPDGTPVTITINHSESGTINLPVSGQVVLQQCKAVFTAAIPAGSGVLRAFATYNVGGTPASP